jgi:hypothetical protein
VSRIFFIVSLTVFGVFDPERVEKLLQLFAHRAAEQRQLGDFPCLHEGLENLAIHDVGSLLAGGVAAHVTDVAGGVDDDEKRCRLDLESLGQLVGLQDERVEAGFCGAGLELFVVADEKQLLRRSVGPGTREHFIEYSL